MKTPIDLMQDHNITQEDLVFHWEAHHYMSHTGLESKMKNISSDLRDNIANFYKRCRQNGWYPLRPTEGKMTYTRIKKIPPTDLNKTVFSGDCIMDSCRDCPHNSACSIRGKEWLKNINIIMAMPKGGKEKAEEVIRYMKHDFMGGIG